MCCQAVCIDIDQQKGQTEEEVEIDMTFMQNAIIGAGGTVRRIRPGGHSSVIGPLLFAATVRPARRNAGASVDNRKVSPQEKVVPQEAAPQCRPKPLVLRSVLGWSSTSTRQSLADYGRTCCSVQPTPDLPIHLEAFWSHRRSLCTRFHVNTPRKRSKCEHIKGDL